MGGKNIFQMFCVPLRNFVFPRKTLRSLAKIFAFPAKLLLSLPKPVEFGQTLPVYFTACSGSYSYMFTMERLQFYFKFGLK